MPFVNVRMLEGRTHACRDPLELTASPGALQVAGGAQRKRLEKLFGKLRKSEAQSPALLDSLAVEIGRLMQVTADTGTINKKSTES